MVAQQDREQTLKQQTNDIDHNQHGKEDKLNGTFISVLLIGAFIALSWIGIFLLFMDRA